MKELLVKLFKEVSQYAILHAWQGLPEYLPSDLDIIILPEELHKLERSLLEAKDAYLVNLLQHESTCFYFVLVIRNGEKVSFLPIDVAIDYRRDGRIWFSAEELLQGREKWKDFWIASPEVEFKYLLVKKILKEAFPEHSVKRLKKLAIKLGTKADTIAEKLLGKKWAGQVMEWIRAGNRETLEAYSHTLKKVIKRRKFLKDPLNPFRYWFSEIKRIWRRWLYPTGFWIAVLGSDGAGKSTLIKNLIQDLEGAFRRKAVFHFMPALFRKKQGKPVTNPHGKPPRSWLTSIIKLIYYWLDYNLGYWFKIRPALVRSTFVIFDRYYDDLLVDPKRYRYGGSKWLAKLLQRFIPRPDLWLILDVPEEEILRRKQEVPLKEIQRQRKAYRDLAEELPNAFLIDGSLPPKEVARQAEEIILEYMHKRYLSRRNIWFPELRDKEEHEYIQKALGAKFSKNSKPFLYLALPDGRGYFLPLNSRKATVNGLSLYAPQKNKAKLLKSVFKVGLISGFARFWVPKINLDFRKLEELLAEIFSCSNLSLAVSLGTPGYYRKPVIQVMNKEGKVLGYIKIGWNEKTQNLLKNEILILQRLQEKNFPFLVPKIIFNGKWNEYYLCVQSAPLQKVNPAPQDWSPIYEEVVKGMASFNLKHLLLEESNFWKNLSKRVNQIENTYWRYTIEKYMKKILNCCNQPIAFHLAHGDFAPWNAFLVNGNLYLYDWEYASEEMPAGYDIFHFTVQKAWLVDEKTPEAIFSAVKKCFTQTQSYWKFIGIDVALKNTFGLYLLERLVSANLECAPIQKKCFLLKLLNLCLDSEKH